MVMETSYAYTGVDTDFSGNTISDESANIIRDYPFTVQGQANHVRNVIDTVAHVKNGIGVVYWEGTWITVGTNSWEENHQKWEKYGSGWASSYGGSYDPDDAGRYYGGSAVDNQAMFGPDGHPLESLRVWNLVRYGNEVEPRADAIRDTALSFDLKGTIALPETVDAVLTSNETRPVPVVWNVTDAQIATMKPGSVIFDLAAPQGGNVEGCVADQIVERHGVRIIGYSNTPAHLPADASALYSRNLLNFLTAFWDKEAGGPVLDAEIGDAVRLTQGGAVVNPRLLG
jgi:hypothetical protein